MIGAMHVNSRRGLERRYGIKAMILLMVPMLVGCSVRATAVRELSRAVSEGAGVYAADDDPELIRAALPFALKLNESLLAENPHDPALLRATAAGFTQFAYAFVQQDADIIESRDVQAAASLRARAARLYLRARDYGIRGLEVRYAGLGDEIRAKPTLAVRRCGRSDVPLLYWTALSWGAAISLSKDKPDLIADQPIVEAMMDRALELDESFDRGAIHVFMITYEMARQGKSSPADVRARRHYERALELSGGLSAAPMVAFAESVSVTRQDRHEFQALLNGALAIDTNRQPESRLLNVIMQQRANWLLSRVDELFAE